MTKKIKWAPVFLLAGIVTAAGCGSSNTSSGGGGTTTPPPPPAAILTMYSTSANFGDVAVGTTRTLGATFANTASTGAASLTLQQNSVSGTGFSDSGIGSGVTLAPGQFVTLTVSFDPAGTGAASGAISLTSSTSTSPINFALSGNGVATSTHSAALN